MLSARMVFAVIASSCIAVRAEAQPAGGAPPSDPSSDEAPAAPPSAPAPDAGPTEVHAGGSVIVHAEGPVTIVDGTTPGEAPPAPPPSPPPVALQTTPKGNEIPQAGPADDPDRDVAYPRRKHFALAFGIGPSAYTFHSDAIYMGGAFIALGADTKAGSFDGIITAEGGRTEQGLHTWRVDWGGQLSWLAGPIRLGLGPRAGMFNVSRITASDSIFYLTFGVEGLVGVDLYHDHGVELSLAVRPRAECATTFLDIGPGDATGLVGGTAGFEIRWRAPSAPRRGHTASSAH